MRDVFLIISLPQVETIILACKSCIKETEM
jgi:hypothetical protein